MVVSPNRLSMLESSRILFPILRLEVNMARMGNKILELSNIDKRFGDTTILDGFYYSFKRGERIGVIGRNGAGKSTFLKLLTGEEQVDAVEIDKGSRIVYGHYRQNGIVVGELKIGSTH